MFVLFYESLLFLVPFLMLHTLFLFFFWDLAYRADCEDDENVVNDQDVQRLVIVTQV